MTAALRAIAFELSLYRSLARWLTRRPDIPADAEIVRYSGTVAPVLWLWIFGSASEVVAFHLLVPWFTVRIIGLVIGVWGLLWMVGLLASLSIYPHLLTESGLRIRHGPSVDMRIPWDGIAAVRMQDRDLPSSMRRVQSREVAGGTDLQIGVSGRVNVTIDLAAPFDAATPAGPVTCTQISFWADDPRACVARVRPLIDRSRELPGTQEEAAQ